MGFSYSALRVLLNLKEKKNLEKGDDLAVAIMAGNDHLRRMQAKLYPHQMAPKI